jgi:hypothetical protein
LKVNLTYHNVCTAITIRIIGVVVTWVVAMWFRTFDPPRVRFPNNALLLLFLSFYTRTFRPVSV